MSQQATVADAGFAETDTETGAIRQALTDLDIFGFAMENPFSHETRQSGLEIKLSRSCVGLPGPRLSAPIIQPMWPKAQIDLSGDPILLNAIFKSIIDGSINRPLPIPQTPILQVKANRLQVALEGMLGHYSNVS